MAAVDPYGLCFEWDEDPLPLVDLTGGGAKPTPPRHTRFDAPSARRRTTERPWEKHRSSHPWYAEGRRPWRHIVIHHSASNGGNAEQFDVAHRERGWDELGYHFVITNGQGGPDGLVQVGSRWRKQKHGAHCGGTPNNEYNERGIGICLVGDFTNEMPTRAQLTSLRRLVDYLATTYHIPAESIITHRDAPNAHTSCPGGRLHAHVHGTLQDGVGTAMAVAP